MLPPESYSFHRTLPDSVDKGMDGILLGSPREQCQSFLGALSNPGYHNCSHQLPGLCFLGTTLPLPSMSHCSMLGLASELGTGLHRWSQVVVNCPHTLAE